MMSGGMAGPDTEPHPPMMLMQVVEGLVKDDQAVQMMHPTQLRNTWHSQQTTASCTT